MLIWKKSDGTKEMIQKHLIGISIVELHNDMIRTEAEGCLRGARDPSGNVIISNTALRDNLPFKIIQLHFTLLCVKRELHCIEARKGT